MRIIQGHVSQSVNDFPFLKAFELSPYHDPDKPCIFFGVYSDDDLHVILSHRSKVIIYWCGQDALDAIFLGRVQWLQHVDNMAAHDNIYKVLQPFLPIRKIKPFTFPESFPVSPLGSMVYAYAPHSFSRYHRMDLIEHLQVDLPQFKFIIGDGLTSQADWMAGIGNHVYNKCFIGLVLGFAAGGATIMQLGFKGRKVVTNVFSLPHCLPWSSLSDIKEHILRESEIKNPHDISHFLQSIDLTTNFLNIQPT